MQWLILAHGFCHVSTLTWANHHEFNFGREKPTFFSKIKIILRGYKMIAGVRGPVALLWVAISLTLRKQRSLLGASALHCHSNHPAKWRELRKLLKRLKN